MENEIFWIIAAILGFWIVLKIAKGLVFLVVLAGLVLGVAHFFPGLTNQILAFF